MNGFDGAGRDAWTNRSADRRDLAFAAADRGADVMATMDQWDRRIAETSPERSALRNRPIRIGTVLIGLGTRYSAMCAARMQLRDGRETAPSSDPVSTGT